MTKIEACPSPVMVEVRSVPHMASIRSVRMVPSWALGPCGRPTRPRRQQAVLAHQTEHASLGGADAGEAQPRPDLAMTLAVEKKLAASSSRIASTSASSGIGPTRPRPAPAGVARRTSGDIDRASPAIYPRPGSPAGCRRQRFAEGEALAAHRLDLRRAKGQPGLQGARSWSPAAR